MAWEWLSLWWNAIFAVPLLVVLVCLTVTAILTLVTGGIGWFDGGHGAGALDAGDVSDASGDLMTADGHGDASAHDSGESEVGGLSSLLWFLGARQMLLGMLLQVFFLLWGITGISLHQIVAAQHPGYLLGSVPAALLVSVFGTRAVAMLFGRLFPRDDTSAVGRGEMVGCRGRVLYPVSLEAGTVQVRDQYGTLHQLRARSAHGTLDTGREIIVLDYDPAQQLYQVDDAARFLERS